MPIFSGGSSGGSLSGVTVSGTAAAGQVPVASSASAAAWAYPPGYEINYTQITTTANITDTSEATATALLSPGAITFDGGLVLVTFFCPRLVTSAGAASDATAVTLFEGATQITRLLSIRSEIAVAGNQFAGPVTAHYRFTPSAGAHTYTVCAFATDTTGTPQLTAGSGGTAGFPPTFVRFTKV